jgi:hypothetical protein
MPKWRITALDGLAAVRTFEMPGHLSEPEIETVLQRLVSRSLSEAEIVRSSLRKNDRNYISHLERVGKGVPLSYGHGDLHWTAEIVE